MQLEFQQRLSLPRLAWCAVLDVASARVVVSHGADLEVEQDAGRFFEGAWSADAGVEDFRDALFFCGTGGVQQGECMVFSSATDRQAPIYSIRDAGRVWVSNSAFFVMRAAGVKPDPIYPYYSRDWLKIFRAGLHCLDGTLRLAEGAVLHVHYHALMTLDRQGQAAFSTHRRTEQPEDYASYEAQLQSISKQVLAHGKRAGRQMPLTPLASLSRGYDSTATTLLARAGGCHEAITLTDSERPDPTIDSGKDNGLQLGLQVHEYDRWDYHQLDAAQVAEFAMPTEATRIPFASCEPLLAGRLLVTGDQGEVAWDRKKARCNVEGAQPWAAHTDSGLTLTEFRLRVGFVVFSPAYIGMHHSPHIWRVSESGEMAPWRVPGTYDRPIPRRMGEEAGLGREQFGVKKLGGAHALQSRRGFLPPSAVADLDAWLQARDRQVGPVRYWRWRLSAWIAKRLWNVSRRWIGERVVASSPLQRRFPYLLNGPPKRQNWNTSFTFQWAFDKIGSRYGGPLGRAGESAGSV